MLVVEVGSPGYVTGTFQDLVFSSSWNGVRLLDWLNLNRIAWVFSQLIFIFPFTKYLWNLDIAFVRFLITVLDCFADDSIAVKSSLSAWWNFEVWCIDCIQYFFSGDITDPWAIPAGMFLDKEFLWRFYSWWAISFMRWVGVPIFSNLKMSSLCQTIDLASMMLTTLFIWRC